LEMAGAMLCYRELSSPSRPWVGAAGCLEAVLVCCVLVIFTSSYVLRFAALFIGNLVVVVAPLWCVLAIL
jgi:hypothetical protein